MIAEEGNLPETADDVQKPNILVVQLETFFDPTRVRWLKFNEDPVPNWHKLCEEYSSGLYTVPVVGAGTVNTEFETLTGMSLRFFGPGEYPRNRFCARIHARVSHMIRGSSDTARMRSTITRQIFTAGERCMRTSDLIHLHPVSIWTRRMTSMRMAGCAMRT